MERQILRIVNKRGSHTTTIYESSLSVIENLRNYIDLRTENDWLIYKKHLIQSSQLLSLLFSQSVHRTNWKLLAPKSRNQWLDKKILNLLFQKLYTNITEKWDKVIYDDLPDIIQKKLIEDIKHPWYNNLKLTYNELFEQNNVYHLIYKQFELLGIQRYYFSNERKKIYKKIECN